MSDRILVADAISTFTPATPYLAQSKLWLELAGMSQQRYDEEMDVVFDCFYGHLHPVFEMLNELPESAELKVLKSQLNEIIRSPCVRPQNPMMVMQNMCRALADVVEYYHNSRSKSRTVKKESCPAEKAEDLKEIHPVLITQQRAMVLLRILKAKPEEALHTDDCKRILEGAEGKGLNPTVVRRAMCALAEIYTPKIVYEDIGGSYRIRTNF